MKKTTESLGSPFDAGIPRHRRRILVVGSMNMDLVVRVARFPLPGETLAGEDLFQAPGGKGANQAVAAARAGARVSFLGAVGKDLHGSVLVSTLKQFGVETSGVKALPNASTGTAMITVASTGENCIVISPGANGRVGKSLVAARRDLFRTAGLVLLQREIPEAAVARALELAKEEGLLAVWNPAPMGRVPPGLLRLTTVLIVNETEAAALSGHPISGLAAASRAAATLSRRLRPGGLAVITLGKAGACAASPRVGVEWIRPHRVRAVDSTAAGDTFAGALAARLLETADPLDACRFANAAAAISVTRPGAIPSIPDRREIEAKLRSSRGRAILPPGS